MLTYQSAFHGVDIVADTDGAAGANPD